MYIMYNIYLCLTKFNCYLFIYYLNKKLGYIFDGTNKREHKFNIICYYIFS